MADIHENRNLRPRFDLLNCAVWGGIALLTVAFWTLVLLLLLPPIADNWHAVGQLNGCETLTAADCTAYAEGR